MRNLNAYPAPGRPLGHAYVSYCAGATIYAPVFGVKARLPTAHTRRRDRASRASPLNTLTFLWLEIPLQTGDNGGRGGRSAGRPASCPARFGRKVQPWQAIEDEKFEEPVALVFGFRYVVVTKNGHFPPGQAVVASHVPLPAVTVR